MSQRTRVLITGGCDRKPNGQFAKRYTALWDEAKWESGHFTNRGRFLVYRPDYPRAYSSGFALRYHVVWWIRTGQVIPVGTDIHHVNGDKADDRFENLQIIVHAAHSHHHNPQERITQRCAGCGQPYMLPRWRIKSRQRAGSRAIYCSPRCYHAMPKSGEARKRLSISLQRAYAEGRR